MLQSLFQWLVFLAALIFFLGIALFNNTIAWRQWVKDISEGPSIAPFIGGLIGVVAVLSAPFSDINDRIVFLWLPLIIDFGSLPYLVLIIVYLIRGKNK